MILFSGLNSGIAYVLVAWTIRLTMIAVVPLRRSPQAAASWLLLIALMPVPGVLLFMAIGGASFPLWRTERFAELAPFLADVAARLRKAVPSGPHPREAIVDLANTNAREA